MTTIGDQPAVSPVSVRTERCVIQTKEPVSVLQGLPDTTVRTYVQRGPLAKVVCSGARVGLEDPVIKQMENAYVGMDSLGPCKLPPCMNGKTIIKCFQQSNYIILRDQKETYKNTWTKLY